MNLLPSRQRPFVLLLLLLGLSGCNNRQESTAGPTAVATLPAALPTSTPTLEPTAEPTLAPTSPPEPTPLPPVVYAPLYQAAPCAFTIPSGRGVECGYLSVPENRADVGNGRWLRLHVAIFQSDSANPAPDPIIYLEGGPGGDALKTVPWSAEESLSGKLSGIPRRRRLGMTSLRQ